MSFKLMAKALDVKTGSAISKLILLKLCDNANDQGECWPSYQTIANQCEVTKRSVMIHITKLIDKGLLAKEVRRDGTKNKSNLYTISIKGSESPSLGSESPSLGSESPSLGGSESPSPEPISIEPINESFNTFWNAYPKKVMKGNAENTFKKVVKQIPLNVLLDGISKSPQLNISDKQFMPNAQAWLNGRGWEDETVRQLSLEDKLKNHSVY